MNYWLAKTEPDCFNYSELENLGQDDWGGVRNFAALKHMRTMNPGDRVFIYHTGKEKAIIGVAEVVGEYYPDPKEDDPKWITIDMKPLYRFKIPVTLGEVKKHPEFFQWELVTQSRLSVMPVPKEIWQAIHKLGETDLHLSK